MLAPDESNISSYSTQHKSCKEWIDRHADSIASPWADWLLAELSLQQSLLYMATGKETDAALAYRQLFRQVSTVMEAEPNFAPILKCRGMSQVIAGLVRLRYAWIMDFLGYEGSVDGGLELLQEAAKGSFRPEEAQITLALCQAYLLSDRAAGIAQLGPLVSKHPESKLLNYFMGHLWLKNFHADSAMHYISKVDSLDGTAAYRYLPHLDYWKAEIALERGEYNKAIDLYDAAHHTGSEEDFAKDRWYKSGLCYYLSGKLSKADEMLAKAFSTGTERTAADRYAARQAQSGLWPNAFIAKARYSSDGGYFEQAAQWLSQVDTSKLSYKQDRLEYQYRKARLLDLQGQKKEALVAYDKLIRYSKAERLDYYYFAASACLQAALITEAQGDREAARSFYKAAEDYEEHPYAGSIKNKARMALNRMDGK